MEYRDYGTTGKRLSVLGFGMNRFADEYIKSGKGIEKAAMLVVKAVKSGINLIDIADSYSGGYAPKIIKQVFQEIPAGNCHVSVKVSGYSMDYTSSGALKRVEESLYNMGVNKASFGYLWAVRSLDEYRIMTGKGGVLDGLIKAKDIGLIDHVCLSVHASPEDILVMLDNDLIEGITISCSPVNYLSMQSVISKATENKKGIVTMNTLGGGLIPKNRKLFEYLRLLPEESAEQAALRFIASINGITSVLSGMTSDKELEENIAALDGIEGESNELRKNYIYGNQKKIEGFCTGCDYCSDCPAGIPTSTFMTGNNFLLFDEYEPIYGCSNQSKLQSINMIEYFYKELSQNWIDKGNPCISCGKCEASCTQKLPVISRIDAIYKAFASCCLRTQDKEKILNSALIRHGYKKVVFYPGSVFTKRVLLLIKQIFGSFTFEVLVCDRDQGKWGGILLDKIIIEPPEIISERKPDAIVITSYSYADEIHNQLKHFEDDGIKIINLADYSTLPWWYW